MVATSTKKQNTNVDESDVVPPSPAPRLEKAREAAALDMWTLLRELESESKLLAQLQSELLAAGIDVSDY